MDALLPGNIPNPHNFFAQISKYPNKLKRVLTFRPKGIVTDRSETSKSSYEVTYDLKPTFQNTTLFSSPIKKYPHKPSTNTVLFPYIHSETRVPLMGNVTRSGQFNPKSVGSTEILKNNWVGQGLCVGGGGGRECYPYMPPKSTQSSKNFPQYTQN